MTAPQVTDADLPAGRIDFFHFVANAYVDSLPLTEPFGSADNQRVFLVDNTADVVRDSSGRIGCMRTPLEDYDIKSGISAFRLGRGAHSSRISADNNKPFRCHIYCSLDRLQRQPVS